MNLGIKWGNTRFSLLYEYFPLRFKYWPLDDSDFNNFTNAIWRPKKVWVNDTVYRLKALMPCAKKFSSKIQVSHSNKCFRFPCSAWVLEPDFRDFPQIKKWQKTQNWVDEVAMPMMTIRKKNGWLFKSLNSTNRKIYNIVLTVSHAVAL